MGNDLYVGWRLVYFLYEVGMYKICNIFIFFGDCVGNSIFEVFVDNIIGVVDGVRFVIIENYFLIEFFFD